MEALMETDKNIKIFLRCIPSSQCFSAIGKISLTSYHIHVIFSQSQIGRFGISQREIGVSDREIFAR